ncbi:MAG: nucleoside hydrolase [Planctomycetia bacterium]|nr:nucleoside hydrolase [Planctomycetia bacterium]
MKYKILFLLGLFVILGITSQLQSQEQTTEPIPILFDTDMDTDCDDLGAMAVLHTLANEGRIEILATVVSSKYAWSAPCVEAINRYYGRPELPIGVPKGKGASVDRGSTYAKAIAERFPGKLKTNDDAPDAVPLYRKILAAARDHSVVIVTVGYLTNLSGLLDSPPDEYSPLAGKDLIRQKVKSWFCMGGGYPSQLKYGDWGNFMPDPPATFHAINNWPLPICFSVEGEKVLTGATLDQTPDDNPIRMGYKLYLKEKKTRPSWDQLTLLAAVFPDDPRWVITRPGCNHIFDDGTNQWQAEPKRDHILYRVNEQKNEEVARWIDGYMTAKPR